MSGKENEEESRRRKKKKRKKKKKKKRKKTKNKRAKQLSICGEGMVCLSTLKVEQKQSFPASQKHLVTVSFGTGLYIFERFIDSHRTLTGSVADEAVD